MKKSLFILSASVMFVVLFFNNSVSQTTPSVVAEYEFEGTLTDRLAGSTLNTFGPTNDVYNRNNIESGFSDDNNGTYWYWLSSAINGGGFWIDVNSDIRSNYTIGVRFSFNQTTPGYRKIIDYQNSESDNGFYFYQGNLNFYPSGTGTTVINNNQLVDLVATRTSDGTFKAYLVVNGVVVTPPELNVNAGVNGYPVLVNGKPRFGFFFNDRRYDGEATNGGKVYGIKIWNGALTADEIQAAMNPKATISNVSITGVTGAAITPKEFNITMSVDTIKNSIAQNTDLSSWITNLPTGLTVRAKNNVNIGATVINLEVSGTPSTVLSDLVKITIPASALKNNTTVVASQNPSAFFGISPFTVTYFGNSNTGGSVPVDGNTYSSGSTVTVLGNTGSLVKTGYTFQGWNTKADGSGTYYASGSNFTMGTYSVNLYARWTQTTYPPPTVTTQSVTGITLTTATGNGNITYLGNTTTTAHGVCWGTNSNPTISNASFINKGTASNTGAFTANITGLLPGTTYYLRAFATNTGGTSYGEQVSFTTIHVTCSFTCGSTYTPTVTSGNKNQPIGRFQISGANTGASLIAATIILNGTRTGASNFKLWYSDDNIFDPNSRSDTQLDSVITDPGTGNPVNFSSFNQSISTNGGYYFLTCDLSSNSSGEIQGVLIDNGSLTISSGILSATINNQPLSSTNSPLPVTLTSFTFSINNRDAILNWKTASETNNNGFEIERKTIEGNWVKAGFVKGYGTTNLPNSYTFEDKRLPIGKHYYRLKQFDNNGNFVYHTLNGVLEIGVPKKIELSQNYPNPFNPETKIDFTVPLDSRVSLKVYDISGREIVVLLNNELKKADYYSIVFNARNLTSGVYFYKIEVGNINLTKKMVVLK